MRPTLAALLVPLLVCAPGCDSAPAPSDAGQDAGPARDAGEPVDAGAAGDDAGGGEPDAGRDAGPDDGGPASPAAFEVSPGPLALGTWTCGEDPPPAQSVTVRNTGGSAGWFEVAMFGPYRDYFELGGALRGALEPGAMTTFTVRPRLPASLDATIRTSLPFSEAVTVSPIGDATGGLTIDASFERVGAHVAAGGSVAFGDRALGSTSTDFFSLVNAGNRPAELRVEATLDAPFTVSVPGAVAGRVTLAPGAVLSGTVTYAPTSAGEHRGRVALVPVGAVCGGRIELVTLSGQARTGSLRSSGDLDFGETTCGATAAPQTVSVSNAGGSSLTWAAALGLGAESPFTIAPASGTLAPGASANITVTPRPIPAALAAVPLDRGDALTLTSSVAGDEPRTVRLSQRAGGAILRWVDATRVTLSAPAGRSVSTTFALENVGTRPAEISFGSTAESVSVAETPGGRLEPGQRLLVRPTFTAAAGAPRVLASIRALATGACATPAPAADPEVVAQVVSGASLYIPFDALDLGTVDCDATHAPGSLPLTNLDAAPLPVQFSSIGSFSVEDGGAALGASFTLAPGETRVLTVRAPPTSGSSGLLGFGVADAPWREVSLRAGRRGVVADSAFGVAAGAVPAGVVFEERVVVTHFGTGEASLVAEHLGTGELVPFTLTGGGGTTVRFPRTAPSGPFTDTIRFHRGASGALCGALPADVTIAGTGELRATSIETGELDFGDVLCGGGVPAPRDVVLRNHGAAPISFTASVAAMTPAYDVSPPSGTVPAGGTATLRVRAHAVVTATPGTRTQPLVVRTASATHTVELRQLVRGMIVERASPTVTLPTTRVGDTSAPVSLGLSVSGNALAPLSVLEVADPMNELAIVRHIVLGGGGYAARFSPAVAGARRFEVELAVPPDAALCAPLPSGRLTLSGEGAGTFGMDVVPSSLAFGEVACQSTPPPRQLTVQNRGTLPLPFTVETAPDGWLSATPSSGTVPVGGSASVLVTSIAVPRVFRPTSIPAGSFVTDHVERITVRGGGAVVPVDAVITARGEVFYHAPAPRVLDAPSPGRFYDAHTVYFSSPLLFGWEASAAAPCVIVQRTLGTFAGVADFECPMGGGGSYRLRVAASDTRPACSPDLDVRYE